MLESYRLAMNLDESAFVRGKGHHKSPSQKKYQEVLENLDSVQGALLRMNRSIQAEGTYGSMKWNRSYKRAFRRGIKDVILEFTLIAIGFNLWKYHNKTRRLEESA